MSKLKKLLIVMLILFVVPYGLSLMCYNSVYESKDKSRYLVVKKGDEIVGYILGSMHYGFTEEELAKDKSLILEILSDVKNVFFEAKVGHWATLKNGLEKVVLEQIEKSKIQFNNISGLESISSQRSLIGSLFYFMGTLYYLPYGNLFASHPDLASALNSVNNLILFIPNFLYQKFVNPYFSEQVTKENSDLLTSWRYSFLQGRTGAMQSKYIEQFRIVDRDKKMYRNLKNKLKNFSSKNKFLLTIGTMHLSANQGILSHFTEDGYEVQELKLSELLESCNQNA